jgi:hypothetical protein
MSVLPQLTEEEINKEVKLTEQILAKHIAKLGNCVFETEAKFRQHLMHELRRLKGIQTRKEFKEIPKPKRRFNAGPIEH